MSRPHSLATAVASQLADPPASERANGLLPPALKGIALGFLGGSIAVVSIMLMGSSWNNLAVADGRGMQVKQRELPRMSQAGVHAPARSLNENMAPGRTASKASPSPVAMQR